MVTLAEFVLHITTSTVVMMIGFGAVAFVRFRYDTAHRSFRRFAVAFVGLIVLIAGLSASANVAEVRCRRDPQLICRYNDNVPFMATIVTVFFLTALVRSRMLYNDR